MDARTLVRKTDPQTSYEAARSLSADRLSWCRRIILQILREKPMIDEEIARAFPALGGHQSPSSLRTRRAELVDAGLVRDSGLTRPTASGRRSIVWEAIPEHPEQLQLV